MTWTRISETASRATSTSTAARGDGRRGGAVAIPSGTPKSLAGSGVTSSRIAGAKASVNQTTGGSSSHDMTPKASTPQRLPAMFSV